MSADLFSLRREVELERQLATLRRENALSFFEPHAKQQLFFSAASYHYRYARTGNRFGKSEMGAAEDISFALGYRPWIPEGNPLRTLGIPSHPTKGLIITTDWDKSTDVFTSEEEGENAGKLFRYIPKDKLVGVTRNHSGAIDCVRVRHVSGRISVIHLDTVKSFKQNPLGQESSLWDWVHVDEPIPEQMWKAVSRGLVDRDGRAWFTCTPLTEPWIDMKFSPDIESQSRESVDTYALPEGDFWMMTGSMDDNPHLTREAIARFMAQLTDDEKECRRTGIPAAYAGIVYKEFDWNIHALSEPPPGWKSWLKPPDDHCIRFAIDYHPRKPHAVLFIATSPADRHYVFAEIWHSCIMSDLVELIRDLLPGRRAQLPGLIDPLADTPNRVTDITPLEEVQRLGLPVIPATKDPHNGILSVKAMLKSRDRTGRPMIVFNRALRQTMMEISRGYIWDGETNKPEKKNDDMMENLYRLHLQGLKYVPPTTLVDFTPPRIREVSSNLDLDEFNEAPRRIRTSRFSTRYRS